VTQPAIRRGPLSNKVGTEVATLRITLLVSPLTSLGGVPLASFAMSGGFDGATLEVRRYFATDYTQEAVGSLQVFKGQVAGIEVAASEVRMDVKSAQQLLDTKLPKNIYQAPCLHSVYDNGCQLERAAFTVAANVTASSSRSSFLASALTQNSGHFELGSVTFTSGQNAGTTRTVKSFSNGTVGLMFPLPYVPAAGDLFSAVPGCDNLLLTCDTKFNNKLNFRGYPFIPVPEVSY
jgi:uncharacterized phage protein (TIGR02218 family)